jgi:O-antigen/teichoic acid export membrane protein
MSTRRNISWAFCTQISTVAFTGVLTLVLIRVLGAKSYGEFAVAVAVGGIVLLPADFGVSASTARFLAETRGDHEGEVAIVASALRLKLAISSVISVGLWLAAPLVSALYPHADLVWPLRGVAVAVLGQSVFRLATTCFAALRRNSAAFATVTAESAAELIASVALVALGTGATGAAFGRAAGYLAGSLLSLVVLARLLRISPTRLARHRGDRRLHARIAGYGSSLMLADAAWALFSQIDVLLIGAILGSAAAGAFQAPMRLLTLASYPGIALGSAIGPRLARSAESPTADTTSLLKSIRLLLVAQGLASAFAVAWAATLTRLTLGHGYGSSATVVAVLAPYLLLGGLAPLLSNAIDYVGATRLRAIVAVVALLVNVVLDLVLLRTVGIVGAAIGTDVGYALYVLGHLWVAGRALEFPIRGVVSTAVRVGTAAAAAAGLLLAGNHLHNTPGRLGSVVLALCLFGMLLAALGVIRLTSPFQLGGRARTLIRQVSAR